MRPAPYDDSAWREQEPFIALRDSIHLPKYKVSARFPVFCIDDRRLAGVTPPSHSLAW